MREQQGNEHYKAGRFQVCVQLCARSVIPVMALCSLLRSVQDAVAEYSKVIEQAGDAEACKECKAKALNNRALCHYKLVMWAMGLCGAFSVRLMVALLRRSE